MVFKEYKKPLPVVENVAPAVLCKLTFMCKMLELNAINY